MILDSPILFTSVVAPIAISLALPLLDDSLGRRGTAAAGTVLLMIPAAAVAWIAARFGLGGPVVDPVFFRSESIGRFSMLLDGLSAPLAISIALVTVTISVYSLRYMEHRFEEFEREEGGGAPGWGVYYMLYVMFAAAMMGTVLSTNLIEFYLFLEVSLLPSFLLIAFYGYGNRGRIALLYLIWTHVGALVFLVGALVAGLAAGTFDFYDPELLRPVEVGALLPAGLRMPVVAALCLGLFVKLAVFGVHIWLPYAHAEAPTPVSALLSPNLIGIAGYALVRIVYPMFPAEFARLATYTLPLGLFTIVYGGLMALAQDDFKRLLAYSSVSQMGYILAGVSTLTPAGVAGAMTHYAAHAVGKALLFSTAGVLIVQMDGLRSISKMGGLASRMPMTSSLALLGFMHITGIPPSLGLWSEILILTGLAGTAVGGSAAYFSAMVLILLVGIGLSTAYAFLTMKRIFFGQPTDRTEGAEEAGWTLLGPMAVVAAAGILLFLWPGVVLDPLSAAVSSILG